MMTKDEIAIAKLQSKRAEIIAIATEQIKRIDAQIAYINSTPRYSRPKRTYTKSAARAAEIAARRAYDAKLLAEISAAREAVVIPDITE